MSIPFIDLQAQYARLKDRIDARIHAVLDHGRFILGPEVTELEEALATHVGCAKVVSCASGTDALVMPLMAMEIGPGDAVFVPSFTFVATAEAVVLVGAEPVFVDVDPHTFCMDSGDLQAKIQAVRDEGRLTPKLVIPVDLFGLAAPYAMLEPIAGNVPILADAAQSMGGAVGKRKVGTLAPITATSFFPAKPLGAYGDGGAIFLMDESMHERLTSIRVHGMGRDKYDNVRIGINGRLDSLQAAVLLEKLAVLDEEMELREAVARRYDAGLQDVAAVPGRVKDSQSAWAQYTLRLSARDQVAATLREAGVPTAIYYPIPLHLQTAYRKYGGGEGSLPVSERLAGEVLSLPMHPYLDVPTQDRIIATVREALGAR